MIATRLLLRAVAVAALCALPHMLGAQKSKPDKVALRFGWPVGMSARVNTEFTRVQSRSGRRDSTQLLSTYRLRVAAHPKGRLIQADSFQVISPSVAGQRVGAEQLLARLGSLVPSYVVTTEGEFAGVEGIAQMKAALDSLFAPMLAEMKDAPPQLRQLMTAATSPEALNALAAQDWNMVAGTWAGADWEIGEVYGTSTEESIAMFGNAKVTMSYEFSAAERLACPGAAAGAARRCVRLEMRSEPDTAAVRKLVGELLEKVAPEARTQVAALGQMRVENAVTLIADPRNLRPYRLELVKSIEMAAGGAGTEPGETVTRVDRRVVQYVHGP